MPFIPILSKRARKRIKYLLRDEFTTDRAAGSVHGTAAEPGPGTRTVVDTGNLMSIASGKLHIAGLTGAGDPRYYNSVAVTRTAGRVLICKAPSGGDFTIVQVGWNDTVASQPIEASFFMVTPELKAHPPQQAVGIFGLGDTYAILLRAAGAYFFQQATGSQWKLLWFHGTNSSATLYAGIGVRSGSPNDNDWDSLRVPDVLWLPTPVAYDTFTRANGALGTSETSGPDAQAVTGRTWVFDAGIWTVDTNKAKGSPVAGGEVVVNGDFSAWAGDDPDNWTVIETAPDPEVSETGGGGHGTGGNGHCNLYSSALNTKPQIRQTILTVGEWFEISLTIDTVVSGGIYVQDAANGMRVATAPYTIAGAKMYVGRATNATFLIQGSTAPIDVTIDDVSIKALTLSELLASVDDSATSDVVISADATLTVGTQAGIVMNLDDEATPANFVIGYHDGTQAKLDKCVAGVYTSVISAAATYAAGATLVVIKNGTSYSLFYNNAKVGATTAISDAGIVDNTKHGLFSTYDGNRQDNFTIFPRGTGGEYAELDKY